MLKRMKQASIAMNKGNELYEAPVLEVFPIQDSQVLCATSTKTSIDPYEYEGDVIIF